MGDAERHGPHCPICDLQARVREVPDGSFTTDVYCERCGKFNISEEAMDELRRGELAEHRYLLSAACRNWSGAQWPKIRTENINELIQQVPNLSVAEKLDRLLLLLADRTPRLDGVSDFIEDRDYPLLVMHDGAEVAPMLAALSRLGYIQLSNTSIRLNIAGWTRISELRASGSQSRQAFVAMWFDQSVDALYEQAIAPAIRDAGYEPVRVDKTEHVNRIDDEIISQIRRSRFMVADFTGQRQGVYFEAGMMMGLGRNVIWMCQKKEIEAQQPHFDVRQYNFITWEQETLPDARKRLTDRIGAVEGQGPGKPR